MADSMNENQADSSASGIEETIKDLPEKLSKMNLKSGDQKTGEKDDKEEQETAFGNETPKQKSDSSVTGSGKNVRKNLNFDAHQSHDGTDKPIAVSERKDGEWLENNPWENETPSRLTSMDETMNMSRDYTVSDKWLKGEKVDLEKIHLNLPEFID